MLPSPTPATARSFLALVLTVAVLAAGLLIPSPALAASAPASAPAAAVDPICVTDPAQCTPPPMLNKQLLQDPASVYHATTAQSAAIAALEAEAVTTALADHQLPASEADAMRSWGRQEVLAQLWALMIKAIRTDPGSRSAEQAHVVTWLAQMMNRKAEELAHNAGWEYLKWAGRVSAAEPRPPAADVLSDLQRFANGTLQPVGYMFGTAENSDSGYCDYLPPAGVEHQYDGNVTRPGNSAGQWCYPPYQCLDPLGCDNNQPLYETFLSWGEADAAGNWQADAPGEPDADDSFRRVAKAVSKELLYASAGTGFGIETGLRVSLGAAYLGSVGPMFAAIFAKMAAAEALMAVVVAKGASATTGVIGAASQAAELAAAAASAASAAAVFTVIIVAITIAVVKGIDVAQQANTPDKLRDVLANALAGVQNLQPMLTDQSDLTGLFSLFIRATGPQPTDTTCDNDQLVIGGPVVVPCANLTPVPEASLQDVEFKIQPLTLEGQPVGSPTRSDTLTWVDAVSPRALFFDRKYWTNEVRLSERWLVTKTTLPTGLTTDDYVSQSISAVTASDDAVNGSVSWLRRQPDGGYKFLTAVTSTIADHPDAPGTPVLPATCEADGLCSLTDTLRLFQPGPGGIDDGALVEVSIVPALKPGITVTHSANPRVGEPVTLTATETGPDVGPLTYEWYVQPASGLTPVCPGGERFCGYDGPFTGAEIDYTWLGSGRFKAASVVRTAAGRETVTETEVRVTSPGPQLFINKFGETAFPNSWNPDGWIEHAGVTDELNLTIDWGDGETTASTYYPGQGAICSTEPSCPVFTVGSSTRLDFQVSHTFLLPGQYEITATVRDQEGRLDRQIFSRGVVKGQQLLTFPALVEKHVTDPPFEAYVDGGRGGPPIYVTTLTPQVCTVADPSLSRSADGAARTTFTVTLVGPGLCELAANQDGDDFYHPAVQRKGFINVIGQAAQQLDFAAISDRTFGDEPFEVSATGGSSTAAVDLSSLTGDVCGISDLTPGRDGQDRATATATVTLLGAGTCTIEASQAGDAGHSAAESVRRTFEVAKGEQTLDLAALTDRTFGDEPFEMSATGGASSAAVELSSSTPGVCTLSGSTSTRWTVRRARRRR